MDSKERTETEFSFIRKSLLLRYKSQSKSKFLSSFHNRLTDEDNRVITGFFPSGIMHS